MRCLAVPGHRGSRKPKTAGLVIFTKFSTDRDDFWYGASTCSSHDSLSNFTSFLLMQNQKQKGGEQLSMYSSYLFFFSHLLVRSLFVCSCLVCSFCFCFLT